LFIFSLSLFILSPFENLFIGFSFGPRLGGRRGVLMVYMSLDIKMEKASNVVF
jgi:hypothetical protein